MSGSKNLLRNFIIFNAALVVVSFYVAYLVHTATGSKDGFIVWFNQGKITIRGIFISLIFGVVFGFLDNFFLWMGIDKMMSFIPGHALTKGAWGNTYSDFIGATVGASISSIGQDLLNADPSPPIWINAIAMPLGCVLGMYAGRYLTGTT